MIGGNAEVAVASMFGQCTAHWIAMDLTHGRAGR